MNPRMNTHTPGPWAVDDFDPHMLAIIGRPAWKCRRDGKSQRWSVAEVDDLMGDHPQEVIANARLIAAAPDLLKACVSMIASRTLIVDDVQLIRDMHSAIEKATKA